MGTTERQITGQAGTAETAAAPSTRSAFTLRVADAKGHTIDPGAQVLYDPCAKEACELVFDVCITPESSPDANDLVLYHRLEKIGHALRELYLTGSTPREDKFRPHFVRLFYLAQLALEGDVSLGTDKKKQVGGRLSPEAARLEIDALEADLIEDEAPRLKNARLTHLASSAVGLAIAFLVAYVLLRSLPANGPVVALLGELGVQRDVAANFMLLWVGTFVGVCLSYAIRTHAFGIAELTCDNPDFLQPNVRLLLTGTFAALLALVALAGLGDVEIGTLKLSDAGLSPMNAFVIGAVLGLSEKKLMGTVQARLGGLLDKSEEKK